MNADDTLRRESNIAMRNRSESLIPKIPDLARILAGGVVESDHNTIRECVALAMMVVTRINLEAVVKEENP